MTFLEFITNEQGWNWLSLMGNLGVIGRIYVSLAVGWSVHLITSGVYKRPIGALMVDHFRYFVKLAFFVMMSYAISLLPVITFVFNVVHERSQRSLLLLLIIYFILLSRYLMKVIKKRRKIVRISK